MKKIEKIINSIFDLFDKKFNTEKKDKAIEKIATEKIATEELIRLQINRFGRPYKCSVELALDIATKCPALTLYSEKVNISYYQKFIKDILISKFPDIYKKGILTLE